MGSTPRQQFNPGTSGRLKAGAPQTAWSPAQTKAGGRWEAPVAIPGQKMGTGLNWVTPPQQQQQQAPQNDQRAHFANMMFGTDLFGAGATGRKSYMQGNRYARGGR